MDDERLSQPRRRRGRRLPVLTPLVAVVLLVVLATPVPVARLADEKPWCLWNLGVPDEAYEVEGFAHTHNYSPPLGLEPDALPGMLTRPVAAVATVAR